MASAVRMGASGPPNGGQPAYNGPVEEGELRVRLAANSGAKRR
jgi:hypothetical protein